MKTKIATTTAIVLLFLLSLVQTGSAGIGSDLEEETGGFGTIHWGDTEISAYNIADDPVGEPDRIVGGVLGYDFDPGEPLWQCTYVATTMDCAEWEIDMLADLAESRCNAPKNLEANWMVDYSEVDGPVVCRDRDIQAKNIYVTGTDKLYLINVNLTYSGSIFVKGDELLPQRVGTDLYVSASGWADDVEEEHYEDVQALLFVQNSVITGVASDADIRVNRFANLHVKNSTLHDIGHLWFGMGTATGENTGSVKIVDSDFVCDTMADNPSEHYRRCYGMSVDYWEPFSRTQGIYNPSVTCNTETYYAPELNGMCSDALVKRWNWVGFAEVVLQQGPQIEVELVGNCFKGYYNPVDGGIDQPDLVYLRTEPDVRDNWMSPDLFGNCTTPLVV